VIAQRNAQAEIVAVDWKGVLAVAAENAARMGVGARHRGVPGDAFTTDFGTGYDVALVTNFLHHFDTPTCEGLLRRIAKSMKPGGRVAILEFVPNDDRVSPPMPASFVFNMLVGTPAGDAYTFRELGDMLTRPVSAGRRGTRCRRPKRWSSLRSSSRYCFVCRQVARSVKPSNTWFDVISMRVLV
jgi:SAM-dependent methyltransferase